MPAKSKSLFSGSPRKGNYIRTIERTISIVIRLGRGGVVSTKELAREFKVSQRTIQRDMALLVRLKVYPIYEISSGRYKAKEGLPLLKPRVEKKTIMSGLISRYLGLKDACEACARDTQNHP